MQYDLSNEIEVKKSDTKYEYLKSKGKTIELKGLSDSRSSLQNRALHKFFVMICEILNEIGQEFHYYGIKGTVLTTRYTPETVKNFFWRPLQVALFDIQSTKDIGTKEINEISDVIIKYFGEKGHYLDFPRDENKNN